jgi:hypothetical protein
MPTESEPGPKRAKRQHPPYPSYESQNAANDGGCKPAARKTAPTYQGVAQIKREPTSETPASGQEIKREPSLKIEKMLPTRLRFVKRLRPYMWLTGPLLKSGRSKASDRLRRRKRSRPIWPLPRKLLGCYNKTSR